MEGDLSLGSKDNPNYRPMRARQLLAAPYGFVWSLKWNGVSGSDGALPHMSWTRFWLFNLVPVVHSSGPDHRCSSYGRLIADGLFWSPASMLPSEHVSWELLGNDSACVVVAYGEFKQAVDLYIDAQGKPLRVIFQRWSNGNPDGVNRLRPFGGDFSDFDFSRVITCRQQSSPEITMEQMTTSRSLRRRSSVFGFFNDLIVITAEIYLFCAIESAASRAKADVGATNWPRCEGVSLLTTLYR
jgi:hypothetical protein